MPTRAVRVPVVPPRPPPPPADPCRLTDEDAADDWSVLAAAAEEANDRAGSRAGSGRTVAAPPTGVASATGPVAGWVRRISWRNRVLLGSVALSLLVAAGGYFLAALVAEVREAVRTPGAWRVPWRDLRSMLLVILRLTLFQGLLPTILFRAIAGRHLPMKNVRLASADFGQFYDRLARLTLRAGFVGLLGLTVAFLPQICEAFEPPPHLQGRRQIARGTPAPGVSGRSADLESARSKLLPPFHSLGRGQFDEGSAVPPSAAVVPVDPEAAAATERHLRWLAAAIGRYRARHGTLPASLDDLDRPFPADDPRVSPFDPGPGRRGYAYVPGNLAADAAGGAVVAYDAAELDRTGSAHAACGVALAVRTLTRDQLAETVDLPRR